MIRMWMRKANKMNFALPNQIQDLWARFLCRRMGIHDSHTTIRKLNDYGLAVCGLEKVKP